MQHSSGSTDDIESVPEPTPEEAAGRELRRLRAVRGWSQEEVAQRMSIYGYEWHQTLIGRIEAAARPLRLNEAAALAALFEVPLDRLLLGPPESEPYQSPEELEKELNKVRRQYEDLLKAHHDATARRLMLQSELEANENELRRLEADAAWLRGRIMSAEVRVSRQAP